MATDISSDDALVARILDLFAREARVDRKLLQLDARADQLGVSSLDLTLALFELEDHFDIQLPDLMASGGTLPTVGELVRQVLDAVQRRQAGIAAAGTATADAAGAAGGAGAPNPTLSSVNP